MNSTRLLSSLLVVALLLADLVVIRRWPLAPDLSLLLFAALATGQLTLVVAWSLWATAPWLVRLLAPLTLAAWLSVPLGAALAAGQSEWFLLLTLFAALVALPLGACRWAAVRARTCRAEPPAERRACGRFQFSLAAVLSWMTVVAVACALRDRLAFPWAFGAEVAVYGVCLAAVAVGAWSASVVPTGAKAGHECARVAGVTLLCLLAGWTMHHATGVRQTAFFTLLALAEALVICGGLSVWGMALGEDRGRADRSGGPAGGAALPVRSPAVGCTGRRT